MNNNKYQGYITPEIVSYNIHRHNKIKHRTAQITTYILLLVIISLVALYLYRNDSIISTISSIIKKMCNSQVVGDNSNYATDVAKKHASNIYSIFNQYKTKNKRLSSNELFF